MNLESFIRSMMKDNENFSDEDFLNHVVDTLEAQLKEWDDNYLVELIKDDEYILVIHGVQMTHYLRITKKDITELRQKGDYALDRNILTRLYHLGLAIQNFDGPYMTAVFPEIANL